MEPDDPKDKIELRVSMKPQTSESTSYVLLASTVDKKLISSLPKIPRYRQASLAQEDQGHVHAYVVS
jgi:hypothetical protein